MKKVKLIALALTAMVIAGTGCLKDKGFDNNEYGINDPDASAPGVGFNLGIKYKNTAGINVADTPQVISGVVNVSLFSGKPAPADVHVTLQVVPTIVTDYNTANGTTIDIFDQSLFTLSATDVVIPKGTNVALVTVTVPTTVALDPLKTYGIGLKISSADAGYTIASNHDEILVEVGLKNKYDGVYNMKGHHNRVPYTFDYDVEEYMITAGPSSVAFYWPERNDFGHPIGVAPGQTNWYGNGVAPVIVFDPATDLVTDVFNSTGAPPITMFTGAGTGVSRYEPSTKTIYVYWNYNNNPLRAFFDTLVYTGPRP
jgi:hypothetical protein